MLLLKDRFFVGEELPILVEVVAETCGRKEKGKASA